MHFKLGSELAYAYADEIYLHVLNLIRFCALWLLLLSKMYVTKVFTCLPEMAPIVLES